MEYDDTINLLLLGSIGTGKSSTGNTLLHLKRNPFELDLSQSDTTATLECQADYSRFQEEKILKIVDMPGLDNKTSDEDAEKHVVEAAMNALVDTPYGYDALLVVIQFGVQSRATAITINQLKKMFGKDVFKQYGILVVTHGDKFKRVTGNRQTFEKYCARQRGQLHQLWEECNRRAVLIDNITTDQEEIEAQRGKLFAIAEQMRSTQRYTPDLFKAAKRTYNEMLEKAKPQKIIQSLIKRIRLAIHDLENVDIMKPESAHQLKEIKSKAKDQKENVSLLLEGNTRDQLLQLVNSLTNAVQTKKELIDMKNRAREADNKMAQSNQFNAELKEKEDKMNDLENELDQEYHSYLRENTNKMKLKEELQRTFEGLRIGDS